MKREILSTRAVFLVFKMLRGNSHSILVGKKKVSIGVECRVGKVKKIFTKQTLRIVLMITRSFTVSFHVPFEKRDFHALVRFLMTWNNVKKRQIYNFMKRIRTCVLIRSASQKLAHSGFIMSRRYLSHERDNSKKYLH